MTNGTKIVTSVYELVYEDERGGSAYKSFPLLTQTIRNILFNEYDYVIYTDKHTFDLYSLDEYFNKPNITIKIVELNSSYYLDKINPIRELRFNQGEIYDRIYCVKNYIEVILNKFKFLIEESLDGSNVIWIDSGLFGTSCHDGWRDYMNQIAHSKNFLDKILEKVNTHGFISLRGEAIQTNYELKDKIRKIYNHELILTPGCLFGGKSDMVQAVLKDYLSYFEMYVGTYNELISEQEVLSVLTHKHGTKFFNFLDWSDLQRGFLDIMDFLDTDRYKIDRCYD